MLNLVIVLIVIYVEMWVLVLLYHHLILVLGIITLVHVPLSLMHPLPVLNLMDFMKDVLMKLLVDIII